MLIFVLFFLRKIATYEFSLRKLKFPSGKMPLVNFPRGNLNFEDLYFNNGVELFSVHLTILIFLLNRTECGTSE